MTRLQRLSTPSRTRARGSTTSSAGWITSGELAAVGRARDPGHHLQPVDLPEGDRGQRRLRRPAAPRWWPTALGRPTPTGTWSPPTSATRWRILRPVYDESDGGDGYVSVEVAPVLARDTAGTIESARHLHRRIDQPNLYVKIPGTAEGVPAIRQMIAEGHNINVTLIFSVERYDEVIEAYLSGLEACRRATCRACRRWRRSSSAGSTPRSTTASSRSAPTRRWPCGARRRWPTPSWPTSCSWSGSPAPAGRRWRPGAPGCSGRCGRRRRPRTRPTPTRSTSTAHRAGHGQHHARRHDRGLRGPRHRGPHRRPGVDEARAELDGLAAVGVDMADVARVLEDEGVASFAKSFDELLGSLPDQGRELRAA